MYEAGYYRVRTWDELAEYFPIGDGVVLTPIIRYNETHRRLGNVYLDFEPNGILYTPFETVFPVLWTPIMIDIGLSIPDTTRAFLVSIKLDNFGYDIEQIKNEAKWI